MQNGSRINGFPKTERLNSYNVIAELFNRNAGKTQSFLVYPFKIVVLKYSDLEGGFPEVLISVPKRNFKKAVDRNRIKRLTKEAYRIQKIPFSEKTYLGLLYVGREILEFQLINKAITKTLERVSNLP